jgi:hypothetical protein
MNTRVRHSDITRRWRKNEKSEIDGNQGLQGAREIKKQSWNVNDNK